MNNCRRLTIYNYPVKRKIVDCFIKELQTKQIDSIQIVDLVKKANISRVTFYKYFKNKIDIIDSLLEDIVYEFHELLKKNIDFLTNLNVKDATLVKNSLFQNTLEILCFFKSNRKYIEALLSIPHIIDFMDILHSVYYNHFFKALPLSFHTESDLKTLKINVLYMTNGISAIVKEWFLLEFKEKPEVIAEHMVNTLSISLSSFLN